MRDKLYRRLIGKLEGRTPLERPSRRWKNSMKISLTEIRPEGGSGLFDS
jgi:hypothetical protein